MVCFAIYVGRFRVIAYGATTISGHIKLDIVGCRRSRSGRKINQSYRDCDLRRPFKGASESDPRMDRDNGYEPPSYDDCVGQQISEQSYPYGSHRHDGARQVVQEKLELSLSSGSGSAATRYEKTDHIAQGSDQSRNSLLTVCIFFFNSSWDLRIFR